MGNICSRVNSDDYDNVEEAQETVGLKPIASRLVKKHPAPRASLQVDGARANDRIAKKLDAQYDSVKALDGHIRARSQARPKTALDHGAVGSAAPFADAADYMAQRGEVVARESTLAFDYRCAQLASDSERRANEIIQALKRSDKARVFDVEEPLEGRGGQRHPRFAGDHFLSNRELIEKTALFRLARKMPKGAHLHVHFNSCLLPHVLVDIAKTMDRMFITSDLPLVPDRGYLNYARCEIQFSILSADKEKPGNLFAADYEPRQTMKFADFLRWFPRHYMACSVDEWLTEKLVFHEAEAHGPLQTQEGAWEKFNGRTRMMKGLFNYETAYRRYTRLCLQQFMDDNIQYAEIRPNFMKTNQLWTDDGLAQIDNAGIMEIIMEEYERFQAANQGFFGGLKVIYCTPRSFSNELVRFSLGECLEFKQRWPKWIAGYDLVGEEAKGRPLKDFVPEFLEFREQCRRAGVEIPFLFHCGETLDVGTETDGNLVDALLLGARRIGHGFALTRHPYVMEQMKRQNVCLEVCPISNEILGLTPRVNGHAVYALLANNVHCTVNSDNGTLFRSTLSHDFYQVMVGKADMTLFGWRQLVEWSLQHACLSDEEYREIHGRWLAEWDKFVRWILDTYEAREKVLPPLPPEDDAGAER